MAQCSLKLSGGVDEAAFPSAHFQLRPCAAQHALVEPGRLVCNTALYSHPVISPAVDAAAAVMMGPSSGQDQRRADACAAVV